MTARVRFKRHDNGVCVAHVTMPVPGIGAVTVSGFGDFLNDALRSAASVATRITSDPVIAAVMPPQVTAAAMAVKAIAAAAGDSPEALHATLSKFSGPGKERLVTALKTEQKVLDAGGTAKQAADAALKAGKPKADNGGTYSSSGLPSFLSAQGVGDFYDSMRQQAQVITNQVNAASARKAGVSSDRRGRSIASSPRPNQQTRKRVQPSRVHSLQADRKKFGDSRAPIPDEYEGTALQQGRPLSPAAQAANDPSNPASPYYDPAQDPNSPYYGQDAYGQAQVMPPGFAPPDQYAAYQDPGYAAQQYYADQARYQQAYAQYAAPVGPNGYDPVYDEMYEESLRQFQAPSPVDDDAGFEEG